MKQSQRYPLSTAGGQAIPLELIRPLSIISKDFAVGAATPTESLGAEAEVILVEATEDCFIRFEKALAVVPVSASPSVPVTNTIFLRKDEIKAIAPANYYFSVIGTEVDGTLLITILETWALLSLGTQQRHK